MLEFFYLVNYRKKINGEIRMKNVLVFICVGILIGCSQPVLQDAADVHVLNRNIVNKEVPPQAEVDLIQFDREPAE